MYVKSTICARSSILRNQMTTPSPDELKRLAAIAALMKFQTT
jgi:hypothetical protein